MRLFLTAIAAFLLTGLAACHKENGDDTLNGRFQGLWAVSTDRATTLVVTEDISTNGQTPNMFLNVEETTYPMHYTMNEAGNMIYLTSNEGTNKAYDIDFSVDRRSFTIKKFHSALPGSDMITFIKVH